MTVYSHSRLSTFEQCPFKYQLRYIDHIDPDFKQSIEGFLGNKVHDTLEWLYNHSEKQTIDSDQVIKYYIENWNKDFNTQIKIVKQDLTAEVYFNKGLKFLINYFLKNKPFEDGTIATEKKIFINLDKEGSKKLIGYIDRLVHNKEANIFEVHDYKTSGSIKSQQELDNDRQLALYSIAIREEFNPSDVYLKWHFLDFNKTLTSKRTLEQLEQLKQDLIKLINKIENETDFPPQPSILCNWCEYQSKCDMFQRNQGNIQLKTNKCNDRQVSLERF
jgi:putative RecB family exonuclease